MYPIFLQTESITIGSYGVMLAIAYLTGRYFYIKGINQASPSPVNTELLIILLLVFGVIGAKIMHVIKNPENASLFDFSSLIQGSGFSSQGAIIGAILVTVAFTHFTKVKLHLLLDNAAFPAIIAYGLARIGCFLAGDDCYGTPTDLPWGMAFPEGVAPTKEHVHPVPLYELGYSIVIATLIYWYGRQPRPPYSSFFLLFLTWGFCRFLVEFVSSNPDKLLGMSGSQFGALVMFLSGLAYYAWLTLSSAGKTLASSNTQIKRKKKPG